MKHGHARMSFVHLILTFALGLGFATMQREGWKELEAKGIGSRWAETGRWVTIKNLIEGPAIWGKDYTITQNGEELYFRAETKEMFAPDDPFLKEDISLDVTSISNSSSGYLGILIVMHLLHLALGLTYLVVNGIRVLKGTIHPGDTVRLHTAGVYWHFLGLLWIYLFAFLFFIH